MGLGLALSTLGLRFSWPIARCDLGRDVSSVHGNRRAQRWCYCCLSVRGTTRRRTVSKVQRPSPVGVVGYIHCVPSRDVAIVTRTDCGKGGLFRRWGHDGLARGAPSSITRVLVTRESGERRPYQGTWCDAGRRHHPMCTCTTHTCSFTTLLTVRLPHPPCAPGGQQPSGGHLLPGLLLPG